MPSDEYTFSFGVILRSTSAAQHLQNIKRAQLNPSTFLWAVNLLQKRKYNMYVILTLRSGSMNQHLTVLQSGRLFVQLCTWIGLLSLIIRKSSAESRRTSQLLSYIEMLPECNISILRTLKQSCTNLKLRQTTALMLYTEKQKTRLSCLNLY